MKKYIYTLLLISGAFFSQAQSNEVRASQMRMEAIEMMDNGKVDESIDLLEEAKKLDPKNYDIQYEIALAHYMKQDYTGCLAILKKLKKHKDVTTELYQLMGNAYDLDAKTELALKTYDEGIKKFPNSGNCYLEKGNIYLVREEYGQAMYWYEEGIKAEPMFPSNYYRAALIYLNTKEEVWGMIYGEIFMNIERNSGRTQNISKMLYDTYVSEIKIEDMGDSAKIDLSFSENNTITVSDLKDLENLKLPFGMMGYEGTLSLCMIDADTINMESLNVIRTCFTENYFSGDNYKTYPNALFDYQKKVLDAGHMEAYNHWILMMGDEAAFNTWVKENEDKWDGFIAWFKKNPMQLDQDNLFYSDQY